MMNLGSRCRFARECDIFQGKVAVNTPLPIYRNVFCNRGIKGWKNCEKYNELITENRITEKNFKANER
ncbi:hypothetical protein D1614_13205 [Maribellus luteus]|uniref:Uncharacterized protein n=1 Tax=Maribellus luteus TaxID=2305463 RepID=A0A399SU15_9BACT|nr:hypothetical protein [Maribellus luteus]RIJ47546.1 hypothetical protein D1614_13205 [Maribellus luteus]